MWDFFFKSTILFGSCWAGHRQPGSAQELSLDNNCVHFSTVIHELMHVVGFDHEQQRPDQSRYITVNYNNIKKGKLFV
jgi:Notch-like protein